MALTKVTGHVVKPDTNIQFHNTKSTGIVTFAHTSNATSSTTGALQITGGVGIVKDLHVGGNITVGGTLTYDDVTNIDSLGIITARGGIHIGPITAGVATVYTNGNASFTGIITATSFVGPLTGTASGNPTLTSGADDRVITSTGANTIQGESTLTYGTTGQLKITRAAQSNVGLYVFHSDGNEVGHFGNIGSGNEGILVLKDGGTDTVVLNGETGGNSYINSGNIGIGTANPQSRKLHVLGTTRPVEIGSTNATNIVKLYNSATGRATYNGVDIMASSSDGAKINAYGGSIMFGTSASNGSDVTERLRITSSGTVNIGGDYTSTTSILRINTTSYPETTEYLAVFKAGVANGNRFKNRYIKIRNNYTGSVHGGVPIVWEANADGSNNKAYGAVVTEGNGDIRFLNAAATSEKAIGTDLLSTISEKVRITNDGKFGVNIDPSTTVHIKDTLPEIRLTCSDSNLDQSDIIGKLSFHTTDPTTPTGAGQVSYIEAFSANGNGADYTTSIYNRAGSGGGETMIRMGNALGQIRMYTSAAGATIDEKLRIDSSGYIKLSGRNVQGSANGDKLLRIYQPSRTDAEEDILLLQSYNTSSANSIVIGGGDSSFNAATDISFRTAAVNTTSGIERLRITSGGDLYAGNETGYAIFDNSTTRPRFQFRQGTGTNRGTALIETRGDANSMALYIAKSREGNGIGVITSGDTLGSIQFTGADGTNQVTGAQILAWTSGTIAADRIPTNLSFYTHPDSTAGKKERLRITSSGEVQILDDTNAYYKPALNIKNTYHGGYGGAIVFTGENSSGTEYTQARIRTYGGTGAGDGTLAIEAGDLNEVARFKTGKMSIGGLVPNISGAKGLEISNAATTEIRLKNTSGGTGQADGFGIQKWNNDTVYLYDYDESDMVFGVSNSSKMKLFRQGRLTLSPSGNTNGGNSGYALSIVQDGNYNYNGAATGTYPGIHIKSTSTGGGSGASIFTPDASWSIYTNSGQTGLAIAPSTTGAASDKVRLFVMANGQVALGANTFSRIDQAHYNDAQLTVAGGGINVVPITSGTSSPQVRHTVSWYHAGPNSSYSYQHLVTDVWGGSNPPGNTEYIMGGFTIKGYRYSPAGCSNEDIFFHNWGGSMHGYSRSHRGTWDPGNAAYIHSTGYVALRLSTGTYYVYDIDLYQFAVYGARDFNVTTVTYSNNTSE